MGALLDRLAGRRLVGMGCMRLSTEADRDDERSLAVIRAAIAAGVTLLDTADAYALGDHDIGHNERLVARAIASSGNVLVATKGGLTRPGGRWVPNGKAGHLRAACEASLATLGVASIDLYQLHAVDPQTPLDTSVRALAALREEGLCKHIGLCNVNRTELARALELTAIDAVQVALSPFVDDALYGGLVELCTSRGILLLAHSPLGGPKRKRRLEQEMQELAERHGISGQEAALAWLCSLGPTIVPIPGATRVETAVSAARAQAIEIASPPAQATGEIDGEVVVLMGIQGAGKSTTAARWVNEGYERFNRDEAGGKLTGLLDALDRAVAEGRRRFVLDNTYASRASRGRVVARARRHGLAARCVWLDTPLPDAQINACRRLWERYGRLPDTEELKQLAKKDPQAFDPRAQFRYQRELEPPAADEGWSAIEVVPFARKPTGGRRGLIVQIEGLLRCADGPQRLRAAAAEGITLCGISWQPGIAEGRTSREEVDAAMARLTEALGIDIAVCPHGAGPPTCWCRTPLPGLAVGFVVRHGLDPAQTLFVGKAAADKTLAERMGFAYLDHEAFFNPGA
jgi:aryl-alcohol dehydrogenase-like predicted oxidoreductase/predicted kinase